MWGGGNNKPTTHFWYAEYIAMKMSAVMALSDMIAHVIR